MPGTYEGGRAAAKTNKERQGDDFYKVIGQSGGLWRGPKGFSVTGKQSEAGKLGGQRSRRGPSGSFTPKKRECTWCGDTSHLAYSCELRAQVIANRKVREEQYQEQRDRMSDIAKKHGVKRPW